MILDSLDNLYRYIPMHPAFQKVIDYLKANDIAALEKGKYEIDGKNVYLSVDMREGKTREGTRLETHRNYLDIQVTIEGSEEIGWTSANALQTPQADYDSAKDVQFFSDAPMVWIQVPAGHFGIFWPEDGHAPMAGTGTLRKAIFKVAI